MKMFLICVAGLVLAATLGVCIAQEGRSGAAPQLDTATAFSEEAPTPAPSSENETLATSNMDDRPKIFLIGNSLTWDTIPSWLDGNVQWHVDCGKSLPYIFANPEKPCVKTSTLWPTALKDTQFDLISFQPHYGSTVQEDAKAIDQWLAMQLNARIIIHTGWARSASLEQEYSTDDAEGELCHSEAYFDALLNTLRRKHPDREFSMTSSMTVLHEIAEEASAGKAPIDSVVAMYRDAVHMNVTFGRYLMHNLMRQALGQQVSEKGFELTEVDEELKAYLDAKLAENELPAG